MNIHGTRAATCCKVARMGLLSFILACFSSTGPYHKKDGSWYWKDDRMNIKDSESLTMLTDHFATAAGVAYYRGGVIPGSDAATFRALNDWLAKDAKHVYYCDTYRKDTEYWLVKRGMAVPIDGADAATFLALASRYSRDTARIYWEGQPIAIKDPATFEVLISSYARDRITGYYLQVPVEGSDGATFAAVSDFYAKDATHVWYSGAPDSSGKYMGVITNTVLKDASPTSFTNIDIWYGKDASHVYHKAALLTGVDPASFVVTGSYAKDATHVFYDGHAVKDVDAASFQWLGAESTPTADAKDAHGTLLHGARVSP